MEIQWTQHEQADLLRKFYDVANLGCTLDERRKAVADLAFDFVSLFLSRASGQVRDYMASIEEFIGDGTDRGLSAGNTREALQGLSALAQEAEALRAKVAELEKERNDLAVEMRMHRAEVERLKAMVATRNGLLRYKQQDLTSAESRLAAIRRLLPAMRTDEHHAVERVLEGDAPQRAKNEPTMTERSAYERWPHPERYPCGPNCTHDDARTPGHPERVKERSETLKEGLAAYDEAYADTKAAVESGEEQEARGWEEGAEAMRAACLKETQRVLGILGVTDKDLMWHEIKEAIEVATP